MQYQPHKVAFDCGDCDKDDKKARGCKKNKRNVVIELKCTCESGCKTCNYTKKIQYKRCPRALSLDQWMLIFMPYFWHWKATQYHRYPDGRARIYQPSKMLEALDVCSIIAADREQEALKQSGKNG